jgi:hypothetical protein
VIPFRKTFPQIKVRFSSCCHRRIGLAKRRWRAQCVLSPLSHHGYFPEGGLPFYTTGIGSGVYRSEGYAILSCSRNRSGQKPPCSSCFHTEPHGARNSLKRKHMIRSHLAETLITALGTGDRIFVFSYLE